MGSMVVNIIACERGYVLIIVGNIWNMHVAFVGFLSVFSIVLQAACI